MRRTLGILVVILIALAWGTGGFLGSGIDAPKPEVPVVDPSVVTPGDASVKISELPPLASGRGQKSPDFALGPVKAVDYPMVKEREWIHPLTKQRIVFPSTWRPSST